MTVQPVLCADKAKIHYTSFPMLPHNKCYGEVANLLRIATDLLRTC